jgi:hypothetical protein
MRKVSFGLYGHLRIEPVTICSLSQQKNQMTDACYFVQFFDEEFILHVTQHYHYYEDTITCKRGKSRVVYILHIFCITNIAFEVCCKCLLLFNFP